MKVFSGQEKFVRKYKKNKRIVLFFRIFIFLVFLILWEFLSSNNYINPFIFSKPSNIIKIIVNLYKNNNLFHHIFVTLSEVIIAFFLTTSISFIISVIFYRNKTISKIFDPYLTMLNSLPKVALGPIIIIWVGANSKSIILMGILISVIISIQNIYNGFRNTDEIKIKLLKSFGATNKDILFKVVLPSNYKLIINTLKINISMCLIGTIMGEFLTSKEGIGYLILYGSQIFNLDLVMSGIMILVIISIILYLLIVFLEKKLIKY